MPHDAVTTQKVRENNIIRVLLALKERSPLTRNDLCKSLNLSRPTVEMAIASLLSKDLVMHNGHGPSEGGRRAELFAFNNAARYAIGGDLELPELNITLCELDGSVIHSETSTLQEEDLVKPEKALSVVVGKIERMLASIGKNIDQIVGMGLGVPAFLKGDTITISGQNLPQWKEVPLRGILQEKLNIPVFIDNDVNFMALAEDHLMGYTDTVLSYIALRKGVKNDIRMGGSTLVEGKVFHGGCGNAASLQHAYVEVADMERRNELAATPAISADALGRSIASSLLEPIKQMVRLFDPNRLVINARVLGSAEQAFIDQISTQLSRQLCGEFDWEIEVCRAQDQSYGCARGGAIYVLQRLFTRSDELMSKLLASPS
jgi:predicted NBD/HSP70 family sugar kinase